MMFNVIKVSHRRGEDEVSQIGTGLDANDAAKLLQDRLLLWHERRTSYYERFERENCAELEMVFEYGIRCPDFLPFVSVGEVGLGIEHTFKMELI